MRIAKRFGWVVVLLSLLATCFGLMTYTFAGFPFGGATAVAEGRTRASYIILVSFLFLLAGIGVVVACRRSTSKRNVKEKDDE